MTYTGHGHWIPGTPHNSSERPAEVVRCGGPGVCTMCSRAAILTPQSTTCSYHMPRQHRDARPPWCDRCGLTEAMTVPYSRFEMGKLDYLNSLKENQVDPSITVPRKEQESPIDKARRLVVEDFNAQTHRSDDFTLDFEQTYVVTFAYILGGWKAMVSTDIPDNMYYEVTYNKAKREAYVDAYVKLRNNAYVDMADPPRPRPGGFSDEPTSRGGFTR